MEFNTFSKGISLKVTEIERLDFELAYFEAAIEHFSHCIIQHLSDDIP